MTKQEFEEAVRSARNYSQGIGCDGDLEVGCQLAVDRLIEIVEELGRRVEWGERQQA